jgi:xanthine dehydrogenase accessory factor
MPSTSDIYRELARRTALGESVATATVIQTRGSAPRKVGAKMLVWKGGALGTVGGGFPEADAMQSALESLATGASRVISNDLAGPIGLTARGVCGGIVECLVEPWADMREPSRLAAAVASAPGVAIARVIETTGLQPLTGERVLVQADGSVGGTTGRLALDDAIRSEAVAALKAGQSVTSTLTIEAASGPEPHGSARVFIEVIAPVPTLVICGAGHVGQAVANLAGTLGFRVVVLDDRAEFANQALFPSADEVVVDDFARALAHMDLTDDTYLVIVTRGHGHDIACLRAVAGRPAAYVGMIGSRRKVWTAYKVLHDEGVPIEHFARVRAPVGLDIRAETPEEIAVSILAEVVKVRRGGSVPSMSDGMRDRYVRALRTGEDPC